MCVCVCVCVCGGGGGGGGGDVLNCGKLVCSIIIILLAAISDQFLSITY